MREVKYKVVGIFLLARMGKFVKQRGTAVFFTIQCNALCH